MISCVDSHCHLQSSPLHEAAADHVAAARAAGVRELLVAGITPSDSEANLSLAQACGIWTSLGCHPCHADEWDPTPLERWGHHPRVVAVGECGLDYYHKPYDKVLQSKVFRAQIRWAATLDLPLILHNRESDADLLAILREEEAHRGVFHCFGADQATLETALDLGFFVSFAGNVTYPKALFRELVGRVPADRLLVETDAPYLAPVPFRGKTNQPALVVHVLTEVAKLRGDDPAVLGEQVVANFGVCFPRTRSAA